MSRMPAREALLRLVSEGYLIGSTRGFRLPELTVADVIEIFQMRSLLEPRAAAMAAAAMKEDHLDRLKTAYDSLLTANDNQDALGIHEALTEFRAIWLEAVPNRRLAVTISRYFDQIHAIRGITLHDPQARLTSLTLLTTVHHALQARDTLAVMDGMTAFIEASRVSFVAQQHDYAYLSARARK